ncbi:MAG: UDP-N-acetylmuramoyl-L-alanine--D-glutamate ligase [Bacteroidales bacterium]|nr:UDP-N-acetylmuramoyl-L-alanine--D-glutamate ligase [Bacteroidales bacterium]
MISVIKHLLEGKNILILGYGREGQSSFRFLNRLFPELSPGIADSDEKLLEKHPELSGRQAIHIGTDYLSYCKNYDMVIKTPGIPYERVLEHCTADRITSQTDLFLRAFSEKVIGVTGTKGKSTTATLIYHILKTSGRKVLLSGNIGVPPLDTAEMLEEDSLVVFEMSSHQLEHIRIAPHIAVILNIFPEHLDHYRDFTAYKMAKFNIHHMQREGNLLVYNADDSFIAGLIAESEKAITLRSFSNDELKNADAFIRDGEIIVGTAMGEGFKVLPGNAADLPGNHNRMNLMAALLACLGAGADAEDIKQGLASYRRPEHRLEYAGTYRGIRFYDDSIATIPEACISALHTLDRVDLLILGGYDRKLDYHILYRKLLSDIIPVIVFMGDAGKRMYSELQGSLSGKSKCFLAEGMEDTFRIIRKELKDGDVCLLSPAAASYGMFKNFEERGAIFKKMAAALQQPPL